MGNTGSFIGFPVKYLGRSMLSQSGTGGYTGNPGTLVHLHPSGEPLPLPALKSTPAAWNGEDHILLHMEWKEDVSVATADTWNQLPHTVEETKERPQGWGIPFPIWRCRDLQQQT